MSPSVTAGVRHPLEAEAENCSMRLMQWCFYEDLFCYHLIVCIRLMYASLLQQTLPETDMIIHLPECACKGTEHREHGDIVWFVEGPVVGGKGAGKRTLPQCNDKIDTPKKGHYIIDLQVDQVPLQETLAGVFEEDTACRRAVWVI